MNMMTKMEAFTVCCFNVGGLVCRKEKTDFIYANTLQYSTIFLQETHFINNSASAEFDKLFSEKFSLYHSYTNNAKTAGVCILINKTLQISTASTIFRIDGRILAVEVKFDSKSIYLVNVYLPTGPTERNQFINKNATELQNLTDKEFIILAGDINMITNVEMDYEGKQINKNSLISTYPLFKEKILTNNMHDVFRTMEPNGKKYSCYTRTAKSRIDNLFASIQITCCCRNIDFLSYPVIAHDHLMLIYTFDIKCLRMPRGRSYWKLNVSLLESQDYVSLITDIIKNWNNKISNSDPSSKLVLWDLLKEEIQNKSKQYSKIKATNLRQIKQEIQQNIANILLQIPNNPDPIAKNRLESELCVIKEKQRMIDKRETIGALIRIRSKDTLTEHINLMTAKKYEKQKADNKFMYAIRRQNGTITNNISEICNIIKTGFDETFKQQETNIEEIKETVSKLDIKLTENDKKSCEGMIIEKELEKAIKDCQTNKSPGLDGLPVEFYIKFWKIIKPILLDILKTAFNCNRLPSSMYEGVISSIYKGKGDRLSKQNWRPLTMLNTDYKLLAKVLTARLRKVLKTIIGNDQNCSVKNRSIFEGGLLLYNLCQYAEQEKASCIICSIDIKGAFDTVNWTFMFETLKQFGFGNDLINWIQIIYNERMISFGQINNFLTKPIYIQRGIRQGCPLSALLYVICAEVTARIVEKNQEITGFRLPNGEYLKQTRYMDDVNYLLLNFSEIKTVLQLHQDIEHITGAKLSEIKTQIMPLGEAKEIQPPEYLQRYLVDEIKIYGFYFRSDLTISNKNWSNFNTNSTLFFDTANLKGLSLAAKCKHMYSNLLSSLLYPMSLFEPPNQLLKQTTQDMRKLLWKPLTKYYPISIKTLAASKEYGGIGFPNLELRIWAQRLLWLIKRKLSTEYKPWHVLFDIFLNRISRDTTNEKINKANVPEFIKIVRKAEIKLKLTYSVINNVLHVNYNGSNYAANTITMKLLTEWLYLNSKDLYENLKARQNKWQNKFNNELSWTKIYIAARCPYLTQIVKDVHYKIISHAIECRQFSVDRNRIQQDQILCTDCNTRRPETIVHMIVECPSVRDFWTSIQRLLENITTGTRINARLGLIHKIFGIFETSLKNQRNLINFIIFYAQTAIFCTKYYKKSTDPRKTFIGLLVKQLSKIYCALNRNEFQEKFCINNALCEVDGNCLYIKIASYFQ